MISPRRDKLGHPICDWCDESSYPIWPIVAGTLDRNEVWVFYLCCIHQIELAGQALHGWNVYHIQVGPVTVYVDEFIIGPSID